MWRSGSGSEVFLKGSQNANRKFWSSCEIAVEPAKEDPNVAGKIRASSNYGYESRDPRPMVFPLDCYPDYRWRMIHLGFWKRRYSGTQGRIEVGRSSRRRGGPSRFGPTAAEMEKKSGSARRASPRLHPCANKSHVSS